MASLAGITPIITLPVAEKIGWRPLIFVYAFFSIIIGILFYNYISDVRIDTQSKRKGIKNGVKIFNDSNVTLLLVINAIMSFIWVGIISFLPIYLIEGKGVDKTLAAVIFSMIFFTGLFIRPLIGHLSDAYNKRILIVGILLISALSCFLLSRVNSILLTTVGVILSASVSAFFPLRSNYLMNKWPSKSRGSQMGMYTTVVIIISSLSPFIIGLSLENYNFDYVFLLFSIIILIAIFLVFIIKYIYPYIQTKIK